MTEARPDSPAERPTSFPWPPVLLVTSVVAAWVLQRLVPLPWPARDGLASRSAGVGRGLAGILPRVWSIITLRRAATTVRPNEAVPTHRPAAPFRFRRYPSCLDG